MNPLHKRNISINGLSIATFETENTGKPRLLCIHGGPGLDTGSLLPGLLELKSLYDLSFVDLRGNGQSEVPKDGDYSLESYANDILQIAQKIKSKSKLGVFGHSFGGMVAVKSLAKSNGVFDFGVICNSPLDNEWLKTAPEAAKKRVTDLSLEEIDAKFSRAPDKDESYKNLMIDYGPLYFPEFSREKITAIMNQWIFKAAPYRFAESNIFSTCDLKTDCKSIKVPCLVIGSREDDLIPWRHIQRFSSCLSKSTLVCLEGGHFPFISGPKEFLKKVSQWWEMSKKMEDL